MAIRMSAAQRAARRREPTTKLGPTGSQQFVDSLEAPPEPNAALQAAAEATRGIGDNLPPGPALIFTAEEWISWLEHRCAILRDREKELLESFGRFDKGFPTIDNDDVQGRATDLASKIRDHIKLIGTHHAIEKAPVLVAQRAVDGFFKALSAKLEAALPVINRRRTAYAEKVEAERRAAAKAEADRLAAEAQKAAAHGIEHNDADALESASRLGDAAQDAADAAQAPAAELSRVYSPLGGVASLTTRWKLDVEQSDLMTLVKAIAAGKAPLDFVQFNTVRIGFAIRSEKLRKCEGLQILEDRKVT
jgi:hypothetical protein